MTTIQIPANGWKVGTCGWLASGLSDGTITISPGTSKSGKGGLWIKTPAGSDCLAIFNQWDANDSRYQKFVILNDESGFCSDVPLTEAARNYVEEIASDWCEAANSERDEDDASVLPKLVVAR